MLLMTSGRRDARRDAMTATTWIGTSWKMNKLLAEAKTFATRLREVPAPPSVQRFIIPPFPAITTVAEALGPDSDVIVGAQNAHWEDAGAWTGEVSVPQVKDAGATLVELGHSERRAPFNETDATVNLKVRAGPAARPDPAGLRRRARRGLPPGRLQRVRRASGPRGVGSGARRQRRC